MKCFNHHDRDAFGICSVCGKGLCLECMQSLGNKIICKDKKCKNEVNVQKFLSIVLYLAVIAILLFLVLD